MIAVAAYLLLGRKRAPVGATPSKASSVNPVLPHKPVPSKAAAEVVPEQVIFYFSYPYPCLDGGDLSLISRWVSRPL